MNFETYWQQVTEGVNKRGLYTLDVVKDLVKAAFEIGRDFGQADNELAVLRGANLRLEAIVKDMLEAVQKKRVEVEWYAGMAGGWRNAYLAIEALSALEGQLRDIANR